MDRVVRRGRQGGYVTRRQPNEGDPPALFKEVGKLAREQEVTGGAHRSACAVRGRPRAWRTENDEAFPMHIRALACSDSAIEPERSIPTSMTLLHREEEVLLEVGCGKIAHRCALLDPFE